MFNLKQQFPGRASDPESAPMEWDPTVCDLTHSRGFESECQFTSEFKTHVF